MSPDLAAMAIAAIAPFITKGLEKISESIGSDLWELLKSPFQQEDEKEVLQKFEEQPSSERIQGQLEWLVNKKIGEDPLFEKELAAALEKFRSSPQYIQHINQEHHGTGDNVGGNKTTYNHG